MTIPAQQREVAALLGDMAGALPRETHVSAVFIGSDTVWKLKKAVRLPFLDFSELSAREHFLRRELELNKPAAPGMYRDVVAVSRGADGALALGGGGDPVDWVLRMAPVPNGDFLDVIASAGKLTPELLDALGDCVAAYHATLPPAPLGWDSAEALLRATEGNAKSAHAAGLPTAATKAWQRRMNATIDKIRDWLTGRSATGHVRRCHGDLHLGNLCLWEGKPTPFDALEFDEALATIDVGYDLAFLLMDLDQKVGREAANRVMNRYVARTGDIAAAGFPVFLSQRAMIRAHVLQATGVPPTAGRPYLEAAEAYLAPAPSMVVAIGGLQGTGKSTIARALAPNLGAAPGALILRSDEIRKRLHHAAPEAQLPPLAYTDAANAMTNHALIEQARIAAASGQSVIVDATFLNLALRGELEKAVREAGIPFRGIWLHAPLPVLEARVAARKGDASDATVAVLRASAANDIGAGDWLAVDASDGAQALKVVTQAIRSET